MNWYNKVFTDEKEKDKIKKLPRITIFLPDEEVTYANDLDVIFSDYFKDYSEISEDPSLKQNPGNISTSSKHMYIVDAAASFFTEGSKIGTAKRSISNAFYDMVVNPITSLGSLFSPNTRSFGGGITSSHKPRNKNKNKKTKKLNRDKR